MSHCLLVTHRQLPRFIEKIPLYRDGDYAEALNRCKQALKRTAAPDLVTELESQQTLIVNHWAREVLSQTIPKLREDSSKEQVKEAITELDLALSLEPRPAEVQLRQLEDALRSAHTLRLLTRLRTGKDLNKEGAYKNAFTVVNQVREEIKALDINDPTLLFKIDDLEHDIQKQRKSDEEYREGSRLFYEQAYSKSRARLEIAKSLGADVGEMLRAAQAGELWLEVEQEWEERRDWVVTLTRLDHASTLLKDNSFAEGVLLEIRILQKKAEDARNKNQRELIESGSAYLEEGAYDKARKKFKRAERLGFDVCQFLKAVETGRRLQCGREALETEEFGRAELHLIQAVELGQNSPPARDIVQEARQILHKLRLEKAQRIMDEAKNVAIDLLLKKSSMLIGQVEDILEQFSEEEDALESTELRIIRTDVRYYRDIVSDGFILLRKIGEAQIYFERSHTSKEAQELISEVIKYDDGGDGILQAIKRKAKVVQTREGVRQKDYKTLRKWLIGRIDGTPSKDLLQVLHQLEALEAREQALQAREQAWKEMREQQSSYYEDIKKQLKEDRYKVDEDLKFWKKISGITATALVILTVGAIAFVVVSREPLATLSSLPAILVGIVEPIVLNQYNKALERATDKSSKVVDQVSEYQKEEGKRLQSLYDAILGDTQSLSTVPDNDILLERDGSPSAK